MSYSTMNNVPTQSSGSSGVIASDWNTYVRDNFDAIKFGHVVCTSSTRPTGVDEGTMIYESDTQKVYVYNAGWVEIHDLDNTGAAPAAMVPFLAPVGSIMQYAAASEPSGWVLCQGQELAIGSAGSTYYNLAQLLGTTYGALTNGSGGAGSTHFRVPDLQGRVPVGKGAHADVDALNDNEGITLANVANRTPSHTHTVDSHIHDSGSLYTRLVPSTQNVWYGQYSSNGETWVNNWNGGGMSLVNNSVGNTFGGGLDVSGNTGGATPGTSSNKPAYIVLNYIIKY